MNSKVEYLFIAIFSIYLSIYFVSSPFGGDRGGFLEHELKTFVEHLHRAIRYNLFFRSSKKGFSLLSLLGSAEELYSAFIGGEIGADV
jgi:hypothetical protein